MSKPTETCKNCEKDFQEGFEFCPHCGQKTKDELTIGILFYNTIANYFSFDARFFKSFIPLLFRPGYLAKKFIEGKRLLYLHPAQLYLFIAVVFFFINSFNVRNQVQELDKNLAEVFEKEIVTDTISGEKIKDSVILEKEKLKKIKDSTKKEEARTALRKNRIWTGMSETQIDSLVDSDNFNTNKNDFNFGPRQKEVDSLIAINASDEDIYKVMGMDADDGAFTKRLYIQGLKFYKSQKAGSILQTFYDTIPIAMFFLLPIFAFILKVLYYKRGRYAHHLVFSFYYFSFLFTVLSILFGINLIRDIPDWIDWLVALSTIFYLFIALQKFYRQGWIWSFFKTGFVAFMFLLFVLPLTAGILALFAFMFY